MKLFLLLFSILLSFFCRPADPNFRTKPLYNTEYTGFISRNFFQVVVEVPMTKDELSILEERKFCTLEAIKKRDAIVIPLLKKIAKESKWNEQERELEKEKSDDKEKEKEQKEEFKKAYAEVKSTSAKEANLFDKKEIQLSDPKNPSMNRGEFGWFLDSMFVYKEDYSNPEKCFFVFRNIQKNLYKKVEQTKLSFVGE